MYMKKRDVLDLIEKLDLDGTHSTYEDIHTYEINYNGISYEMNISDREGNLINYGDGGGYIFSINNIVKCGKSKSVKISAYGTKFAKLSSKHYENISLEIKKAFKHKYRTLIIDSLD